MEEFTSKERKKEFEKIFKEKILPFFEDHGFVRHTKTSKRLFKVLNHGLSIFLFFEYKNRFGCYDLTIAYFDDDIGNVYDDMYLAMAHGSETGGSFSGNNSKELNLAVEDWLLRAQSSVIPLIKNHSTHKAILESNSFDVSDSRKTEFSALLKRKSRLV